MRFIMAGKKADTTKAAPDVVVVKEDATEEKAAPRKRTPEETAELRAEQKAAEGAIVPPEGPAFKRVKKGVSKDTLMDEEGLRPTDVKPAVLKEGNVPAARDPDYVAQTDTDAATDPVIPAVHDEESDGLPYEDDTLGTAHELRTDTYAAGDGKGVIPREDVAEKDKAIATSDDDLYEPEAREEPQDDPEVLKHHICESARPKKRDKADKGGESEDSDREKIGVGVEGELEAAEEREAVKRGEKRRGEADDEADRTKRMDKANAERVKTDAKAKKGSDDE
jgi:hypothetical protein